MTTASFHNLYRKMINDYGSEVVIRRLSGVGAGDYTVRARIIDAKVLSANPQISQKVRQAVILAEDVVSSGFPLPFIPKQDRIISGSLNAAIVMVDDTTRSVNNDLLAYNIELSGA